MQAFGPPDTHHLSAAIGWIELRNLAEAKSDLAKIAPQFSRQPDVLEVKWAISAAECDWPAALETAKILVEVAPDRPAGWLHHAYALRRVPGGGVQEAWNILLSAASHFPKEPTIAYNLSCYACVMGQLDDARKWFLQALSIGERAALKLMALGDSDLQPLWTEIRNL